VIVKSFNLDRLSRRDANDVQGEIATQSAVNHPNIAKLQAVYNNKRRVRMVIEHLEGGDLFDHLAFRGSFGDLETALIVKQVLEAVEHLHDNGIVHRDIKLENIVYETAERDKVKLIDFGYSTFWEAGQQPMRRTCGTMTYLAPEVLKEAYTNKADLWCVGVAAHAMLTGKQITRRPDGSPVFSPEFSRCSPGAQDFVTKLLRSDPRRRMSASEALKHRWLQEMVSDEIPKLGKSGWRRSFSVTPSRKSLTGFASFGRRKISAWWTAAREAKVAFGLAPEMRVMPSQSA
jgi:serine/threonine protein kinase